MIVLFQGVAGASADDRLAQGGEIAQRLCAPCHATGSADTSPHPRVRPLREIAADGSAMLREARTSGNLSGHDEMPEFELEAGEMAALLDYIESLGRGRSGLGR